MGFDEGSILLNSENETYYAGQTIFGKLVFEQDKVKTFRGLYVKIKGFCKVHWTTRHSRRHNGRTESHTEHHNAYEEYFNKKVYLLGSENGEYHLQPGKHELPFDCPIPVNCPSSFEGNHGHVRYEIEVVVDRAFKFDQEKTKRIRVIAPLDLNADPYCKEPMQFDIEDTYCCCCMSNGSSVTLVKLPVSGYCPGQNIPIEINCSNQGRVAVNNIKLAIKKRIAYHATHVPGSKFESETVVELKKGPIPGNTTRSWIVDIEVPALDVYNMGYCRYIDIEYAFKVTVCPEGWRSNTDNSKVIKIGTVPLVGQQDHIPNPLQDQMPKQVMPIANQPVGPYPSPYPGRNAPYPSSNTPYPGTTPYPAPYPIPQQPNLPYPDMNQSYPTPPSQNPAYPLVTPSTQGYPHPANPYPQNSPYPGISTKPSGMTTDRSPLLEPGSIGFTGQNANISAPSLPPGTNVPYPVTPSSNPYAAASAPAPASPGDEQKSSIGAKDPPVTPYPAYNPDYINKQNDK